MRDVIKSLSKEIGKSDNPLCRNGSKNSQVSWGKVFFPLRGKLVFSPRPIVRAPHSMVFVSKMFLILVFCKVENSPKDKNKTQRRKASGLVFLCRGENRFCLFSGFSGKKTLPHDIVCSALHLHYKWKMLKMQDTRMNFFKKR